MAATPSSGSSGPADRFEILDGSFVAFEPAADRIRGQTPQLVEVVRADHRIRDQLYALIKAIHDQVTGDLAATQEQIAALQTQNSTNVAQFEAEIHRQTAVIAQKDNVIAQKDNELTAAQTLINANKASLDQMGKEVGSLRASAVTAAQEFEAKTAVLRQEVAAEAQRHADAANRASLCQMRAEAAEALAESRAAARGGGGDSDRPKMADPDRFDGSELNPSKRQRAYVEWKSQVFLKLSAEHVTYASPASRIMYVGGRLGGLAWNMVRARVSQVAGNRSNPEAWPTGWSDYGDVMAVLDRTYLTVDASEEARREFEKLKQADSLSHYSNFITEFERLGGETGLSQLQLVDALRKKVATDLYAKLEYNLNRPAEDDLDGWITLFRTYSVYAEDVKQRRQGAGGQGSHPKPPKDKGKDRAVSAPPAVPAGEPMQLDAITTGGPRPPLTDAEKKKRRDAGACMYCGVVGHFVMVCPIILAKEAAQQKAASGPGKV